VRGGVDDAVAGYNDFILTYSYTDASGTSYQRAYGYQYQPYSYGGTTTGVGAFLDDAFRVSSRLTLNLGLRYDHNRASIPDLLVRDQVGDPTGEVVPARHLYSTNTVSPRVGFNLKLTPDGRSVLCGHWGRYYRRVVVGEFAGNIGVSPHETRAGVYDLATGTFVDPAVTEFSQNLGVSPGYTIPHTDQFVASLERELGRDLGLSLHYVYKRGRGFSAWQDIRGQYEDVVYVDDQGVDASGRSIVVKCLLTDPADRFFEQQNPPQMRTGAHALSAQTTKRLSRGWQLVASYTYLRSKGLLASGGLGPLFAQGSSLLSDFGQNPNHFVNAGGLLVADRPHTFKVQLDAELPFGFLVGANYLFQSGRDWGRLMRVPGLGFPNAPLIQREERDGSRRLPSHNILALRLQKSFKLPKNAAFVLFGDVLNAFNDDAHQGFLSRIGDSPSYKFVTGFVPPRRAMLGAKLIF
jgi:outer membrane receptor protein involved in Fe transport